MEKRTLTCIICPNSCSLTVTAEGKDFLVEGNRCKRGEAFAISEMTDPVRTVTLTVATAFEDCPVLPCRTSEPVPKDRVFDVIREINKVTVKEKLKRGDVVIKNVLGLGSDVITTADL